MTNPVSTLEIARWDAPLESAAAAAATLELERGSVLFLPRLDFALAASERRFLSPRWLEGTAKNVSYDPRRAHIAHTSATSHDRAQLVEMMARFAQHARALVTNVCQHYQDKMSYGLASFFVLRADGFNGATAVRPWRGDKVLLGKTRPVYASMGPRR